MHANGNVSKLLYRREVRQCWDSCKSKAVSAYPELNRLSLWITGCCNSSEPTSRGLSVPAQAPVGERCSKSLKDDSAAIVASLRACAKNTDLLRGTELHTHVLRRGLLAKCADALVTMYAKCGQPTIAKQLLHMHDCSDVFSWTDVIAAFTHQGLGLEALSCFEQMQHRGLAPDAATFTSVMKACGIIKAADKGAETHNEISRQGLLGTDVMLGTAVVDMYAKCGALSRAQQVLEELPVRNVISWTALITGYAQQKQALQALKCYERMQHEGLTPNAMTLVSILKACGSIGALNRGEEIHHKITRQGLLRKDIVLGTAMVDMYAKCGAFSKAQKVLEGLSVGSIVPWNALMAGYVQHGLAEEAVSCFEQMQQEGLAPNGVSFLCILRACGNIGAAEKGEHLHDELARQGLLSNNILLGNALVHMYGKCGALARAQQVLEELPAQDVVSWNTLIAGYAKHGQGEQALSCLERMQGNGLSPDAVTMVCILKACGMTGLVENAQNYFSNMSTKFGMKPNSGHYSCIVDSLVRSGFLDKAIRTIQNIPTSGFSAALWSALLGACGKWGDKSVGAWAFKHALEVESNDGAALLISV